MGEQKHDAQEVKEILNVVSTEIPKLLEAITTTVYSKENAEGFAKSVAAFYKSMKEAGMDDKQAYELTQKFMTNFSLGGMLGQVFQGKPWEGKKADDDDK
jgi:hypothetical protein